MGLVAFFNEGNVFFRPPILMVLVWFLWGVNVWVFEKVHINYTKALNFDPQSTLSPVQICSSAMAMFGMLFLLWLLFRVEWLFDDALLVPSFLYIASLFLLVNPLNILHRQGREKLLQNLHRVFIPSAAGVLFVEVVLGDILTSMSKALADLQVSLCILFSHSFVDEKMILDSGASTNSKSNSLQASCAESLLRPLVTSLPFMLRFRQCLVCYKASGLAFPHLVNAAKYASAFPVIWISAFAHHFPDRYSLFLRELWLVAITFNSFFSFLWDVVMDFGLFRNETTYLFLRQKLLYMNDSSSKRRDYDDGLDDGMMKSKGSSQELDMFLDPSAEDDADSRSFPEEPRSHRIDNLTSAASKVLSLAPAEDSLSRRRSPNVNGSSSGGWTNEETAIESPRNLTGMPVPVSSLSVQVGSMYQPLLPRTPVIYYFAIVLDFLLRVLWSFKLSVHLHLTQEGLTFVLEICEVLRRFLWLFFRIEWQCIEMEEDEALSGPDVERGNGGNNMDPSNSSSNLSSASITTASSASATSSPGAFNPLRARTSSDRPGS